MRARAARPGRRGASPFEPPASLEDALASEVASARASSPTTARVGAASEMILTRRGCRRAAERGVVAGLATHTRYPLVEDARHAVSGLDAVYTGIACRARRRVYD